MTTLKNYYITVKSHEIHKYVYRVKAKDEAEAKQAWVDGVAYVTNRPDHYVDTVSETVEKIEEE